MKRLLLCLLFLSSCIAYAQENPTSILKIYFDCYLQFSKISCDDLRNSIFNDSNSYISVSKSENPVVQVIMRDQQAQDGANVITDYIAIKPLPNFKVQEYYSSQVTHDNQNVLAYKSIKKALNLMTEIQSADVNSDGTITVAFKTGKAPLEDTTKSYLSVNGDYYSSTGSGNSSSNYSFNLGYNYSGDKIRVQLKPNVSYRKSVVQISDEGDKLTAETFSYGSTVVTSYLLDNHWNVGMMARHVHNPASNEDQMVSVSAGVEWLLVPFLQTDGKTLIFHYGAGFKKGTLFFPNLNDDTELEYFFQFIMAVWAWHFDRFDINIYTGVANINTNFDYFSFFGGGGLKYYLTKNKKLSFDLNFNFGYSEKSITEPKVIDYSNPLATQMASGRKGLTTYLSIGVSYNIGNAVRRGQDLRFSNY